MSNWKIATSKPIESLLMSIANDVKKLKPNKITLSFKSLPTLKVYVTDKPIIFMFDSYNLKYRKNGVISFNWFGQKPVFLCHGQFEPRSLYEYIILLEVLHLFDNQCITNIEDKYWNVDKKYDYKAIYRELKVKKIKETLQLIDNKQFIFS